MANICDFILKAKGAPADLEELYKDMQGKDNRPRTMAGIYDVNFCHKDIHKDGTETWELEGSCAWSTHCCMTHIDKYCYGYTDNTEDHRKPWFIGIEDEARERNLEIEVHDWECGFEFATRLIARPNETIIKESYDYTEIPYDPDEDNLDEVIKKYGLTEDEIEGLKNNEIVYRSNMDFDEWRI